MEVLGTVAIVTGAASGLGAATAQYLSSCGALVVRLDINGELLNTISEKVGGIARVCDVTNTDSVNMVIKEVIATVGTPKILVNCAGIGLSARIVARHGPHDLEMFRKAINVNLIGTFNMMRLVADQMITASSEMEERGVIINTSSIAAFDGQIGQAAYAASKGAIASMTLPAAREFAQFGIRVMTIAPGLFETPLLAGLSEENKKSISDSVPFPKRLGSPNEFARLVHHIIENKYLNGETIRLDASLRMQPK